MHIVKKTSAWKNFVTKKIQGTNSARIHGYNITSRSRFFTSSATENLVNSAKLFRTSDSLNFALSKAVEPDVSTRNFEPRPLILSPMTMIRESPSSKGGEEDKFEPVELKYDDLVKSIAEEIENHYALENSKQFVGGMGENDGGVWISADTYDCSGNDTLDYWEIIRDIIQEVKQSRHGIPFGVYTSGQSQNPDIATQLKTEIGLSSIQVSLLSNTPDNYAAIYSKLAVGSTINAQRDFGQVCNFIVTAAESGFPVVAAVAGGRHATGGTELAKALGAVDVVVYNEIGDEWK